MTPHPTIINILLVNSNTITYHGLQYILGKYNPSFTIHQITVTTKQDLKQALLTSNQYDLIILHEDACVEEINKLQKPLCCLETLDILIEFKNSIKIIMLYNTKMDDTMSFNLVTYGVMGFIDINNTGEQIHNAIQCVLNGNAFFSLELAKALIAVKPNSLALRLSKREELIMNNFLLGKNSKTIAFELNLHASTIGTYKKRILKKYNATSIVELASQQHTHND